MERPERLGVIGPSPRGMPQMTPNVLAEANATRPAVVMHVHVGSCVFASTCTHEAKMNNG
jgi:hypothetical protein